jgi:hypothetical protein
MKTKNKIVINALVVIMAPGAFPLSYSRSNKNSLHRVPAIPITL